ncbi:ComEA family DNA-binding protein [Pelotalea chapellei]|uniref:Helix-hairpin-helix domain-containing protein n=1 Tax=Pelotalea chapellei TaxID=44671 RepID=A0ABS5U3Y1_9BACT|nr:helix-hairpin-helix domain-containing protein [Pelotalea chapellei]MBT1070376.1 helix-hairpin-helix domain-containing protein [Pelotalea chapellei]
MSYPVSLRSKLFRRLPLVLIALLYVVSVQTKSRPNRSISVTTAFPVISASHKIISIRGDVLRPGIYNISDKLLTIDAIQMALPVATITSWSPKGIETTKPTAGHEFFVSINSSKEAVLQVKSLPVSQRILLGIQLDINTLKFEDFVSLPGIGPALAEEIITFRQQNGGFMKVHDLLSVDGIGEKRYQQLKKYF